jgi:hypothetical protein
LFFIRIIALIVTFTFILIPLHVRAEESEFSEYEVKAGFIYNFAKFIEWPVDTFSDVNKAIILCVVGTDPFGKALGAIDNKTVQTRRLEIKYTGRSKDLKMCSMLFISGSEKDSLSPILETVKGAPILTIGDTKGFAQQGIMINFVMEQNKVGFEINTESARRAKITISSKLLKLAKTIYK